MAYEFLKKLFGTPKDGEAPRAMTFAELEAAIDADKSVSIVNLKDGGYVSTDKFDAKVTELRGVQARSHAEEMFLSDYKFTGKAARNGVLAELRAKDFKVEDGNILGGKEFMTSLMENEDYKGAFVTEPAPDTGGNDVAVNPQNQNTTSGQAPRFATGTSGGGGQQAAENPFLAAMHFNYVNKPQTGGTAAHN